MHHNILLLQELLTKKLPYHHICGAYLEVKITCAISKGQLPKEPPHINTALEKFLWGLCRKCCATNPEWRPTASKVISGINCLRVSVVGAYFFFSLPQPVT